MSRKAVTYLVLLTAVVVLGAAVFYPQYEERRRQEANENYAKTVAAEVAREKENAAKLPHADLDMGRVPAPYPRPRSAWRAAEKAFHAGVLGKGRFDVLLAPFQVQDHAFARDLRSFMTAQLALAIADAGKTVADPYLVARALGEGERRFDLDEVFALANAVGAKRIVLGYVGHDDKSRMRLTLNVYERGERETFSAQLAPRPSRYRGSEMVASERMQSRHFENVAYAEPASPIDAWQALLPEALKFLGLDAARLAPPKPSSFESAQLAASPLALAAEAAEPARDAYYLQLLALLAPRSAERTRERLIEKSLLAVLRMSPDSPDYRVLRARALAYMGLRPQALRLLQSPLSSAERHLAAVLDGDLPAVQESRPAVPAGVRAAIAALEENVIAVEYHVHDVKQSLAMAGGLKLPGDVWTYLAGRALTDADLWTQHENIALKALLDHELPISGSTAQGMVSGALVAGNASKLERAGDLSVLDHLRRHIQGSADWCCRPFAARPMASDFVDLIESIGTDNLLRRAWFHTIIQGNPSEAMQFLAVLESTYKDHPDFALLRAEAQLALAKSAAGTEREGLIRSAYADAFNAWYWAQGQTRSAARAYDNVIGPTRRHDFGGFDNFYANDYPFRPFYPLWQIGNDAHLANGRAALQNSAFDFAPVRRLEWSQGQLRKQWGEIDKLLASLGNRFRGNPERVKLMAESHLRNGDLKAAENEYREGIRMHSHSHELYSGLGTLLFEDGASAKSAAVLTSYPDLKGSSEVNRVGLSNYAQEAGSLYYFSGDFARAMPFYKVAAELNTGSASTMAAATRLALLNGDYGTALRGSLARATRYESPHAYRDYFGLLHAFGQSKAAWEGFTALIPQLDQPQTWETALVGHRIAGASEADIAAWAGQEPMRGAGDLYAYAPIYLLRAGVVDRMPSANLAKRIAEIERPVWQVQDQYRHVVRANKDGSDHVALGPDSPEDATLARGVFERTAKTRVKSDLVYYAEAYAAIKRRDFAAARKTLEEASSLYTMRNESLGYLLPLYAYAAARTRDTASLDKVLETFPVQYRRFDYHLAKATVAAIGGKAEQATRDLTLALHRRPFTNRRPVFTEYQYAEVCEWLFEATGDARYRKLALEWAQKNQAIQPWFAWPYAMQARLAATPGERGRAIAMAYYLDRNSERLATLPRSEVMKAAKEYESRNPFKRALDRAPKQPV